MRLPRPLLVVLLLGGGLTGCTSSPDDAPARFRPPPAAALAAGPCAVVSEDLVALGRAAFELRGVTAPDDAARASLREAQDRLGAFSEGAPAEVQPALSALVLRAGLVRIQSDTRMLRPDVLTAMGTAYTAAADACTGRSAASPTVTTG